jgi:hypothetical protein
MLHGRAESGGGREKSVKKTPAPKIAKLFAE